jgi:translation initiation factor IF-2
MLSFIKRLFTGDAQSTQTAPLPDSTQPQRTAKEEAERKAKEEAKRRAKEEAERNAK